MDNAENDKLVVVVMLRCTRRQTNSSADVKCIFEWMTRKILC